MKMVAFIRNIPIKSEEKLFCVLWIVALADGKPNFGHKIDNLAIVSLRKKRDEDLGKGGKGKFRRFLECGRTSGRRTSLFVDETRHVKLQLFS